MGEAVDRLKRAMETYPPVMGGPKPPDHEVITQLALLEVIERLEKVEKEVELEVRDHSG